MSEFLSHLECSATGERLPAGVVHGVSAAGKPLLVRYDLDAMRARVDRDALAARGWDWWRYRELLPHDDAARVSLGEVVTPLVALPRAGEALGVKLLAKDEGRLPTGSFKARGLGLAVTMARQLGLKTLAMPTNGNAGAALAAYATRAGLESVCWAPSDTPEVNLREIAMAGATLHRVDGLIDDCGRLCAAACAEFGWFNVATLREPYRIEGKKTMGLELAEQLGWTLPEAIFYPTGGGTGLIGMWKAFDELEALGWIDGRRPRMFAVQAAGCAPIVRAFEQDDEHAARWEDAHTVAAGIRVPAALGDFLVLRAVRASGGAALAVDEDAIVAAWRRAAREDGVLLCPEGAATLAAAKDAVRRGLVDRGARVVLFNCAAAQKYALPD